MPTAPDDGPQGDERTFATGLTADEVDNKWHAKSLLGELGDPAEVAQVWECCYLCKRKEGQESVTFEVADGAASLRTPPIALHPVRIRGYGKNWVYRLCEECMLLLLSLTMEDEEEED